MVSRIVASIFSIIFSFIMYFSCDFCRLSKFSHLQHKQKRMNFSIQNLQLILDVYINTENEWNQVPQCKSSCRRISCAVRPTFYRTRGQKDNYMKFLLAYREPNLFISSLTHLFSYLLLINLAVLQA